MKWRDGVVIQHIFWSPEEKLHTLTPTGDCYCEPEVELAFHGRYLRGRIFMHQKFTERTKRTRAGEKMT